jgi:hypothetical protein
VVSLTGIVRISIICIFVVRCSGGGDVGSIVISTLCVLDFRCVVGGGCGGAGDGDADSSVEGEEGGGEGVFAIGAFRSSALPNS